MRYISLSAKFAWDFAICSSLCCVGSTDTDLIRTSTNFESTVTSVSNAGTGGVPGSSGHTLDPDQRVYLRWDLGGVARRRIPAPPHFQILLSCLRLATIDLQYYDKESFCDQIPDELLHHANILSVISVIKSDLIAKITRSTIVERL